MNKVSLVGLRQTGSAWSIEVPSETVTALGWAEKKELYMHSHLADGIWISTDNDSPVMDEIVAATDQLIGHHVRPKIGKQP